MLLVLIDRFWKWTELVPLRSATAESLQKAFRERIIGGTCSHIRILNRKSDLRYEDICIRAPY